MNPTPFACKMRDRMIDAAVNSGWTVTMRKPMVVRATKQGATVNLQLNTDTGTLGRMTVNEFFIPTVAAEALLPVLFDMKEA